MKKLLLAAAMLIGSIAAKAQATEIFYFNHTAGTSLTLFLEDNRACGTIIAAPAITVPAVPPIPGYNHITIGSSSTYGVLTGYDPAFFSIVGVRAILYTIPYTVGEPTSTACGTPTGFPYAIGGGGPGTQYQVSFNFPTFWGPNIVDLRDY